MTMNDKNYGTIPVKILFILLFGFFSFSSKAQLPKVNELQEKLKQSMPDTARLNLLQQLCTAYTQVDPVKKFYYAGIYQELAKKLNDGKAIADSYIQMGIAYGGRSKSDSSIYYFSIAYQEAKKVNAQLAMGRALADIGYSYDRLDNSDQSIKYYFQALDIFKKLKYLRGVNQCYTNIGSIYYDLAQYKQALTYFSECYKTYSEGKDEAGIANSLFSMGDCYRNLNRLDEAMDALNRSLAIRTKLGDLNGIGLVNMGLGNLYIDLKKYDKAKTHLDTALVYTRRLKDVYEQTAVLSGLANLYIQKKQYDTAENYAMECLRNAREAKTRIGVNEGLKRLYIIYQKRGDYEKAYKYQSQYISNNDSIQSEKVLRAVAATEFDRIRGENETLAKNNLLISQKNNSYQLKVDQFGKAMVAALIALGLLITLIVVLVRQNNRKQAVNKLLTEQKEEIAAINHQLESLNEELHTQMDLVAQQNIELERLNEIKNKFFSIISHDMRSPLSTLQILFSVYRSGGLENEELDELLLKLEDTIVTTSAFLDNLLEWSKSQLEGMKVNAVDFDISKYIADNVHLSETKTGLKNLEIVNLATSPVMVHADADMINLVIRNLLSNSAKFCSPGDRITIDAKVEGDKALVSISDTGPGISEADKEKIFNLEHSMSKGTQGEKGNRLGLVLCRDMLLQNKGNIWFESQLGQGTTFWFDLPLADVQV